MIQTTQQRRAQHALAAINGLRNESFSAEIKREIQSAPAMIHMNGLGQTVAFHRAKSASDSEKAKAHGKVYELLEIWLTSTGKPYGGTKLLDGITTKDMHAYIAAQAEALAYLDWLKKFAEAFIDDPEPTHGEGERKPDNSL